MESLTKYFSRLWSFQLKDHRSELKLSSFLSLESDIKFIQIINIKHISPIEMQSFNVLLQKTRIEKFSGKISSRVHHVDDSSNGDIFILPTLALNSFWISKFIRLF